MGVVLCFYTGRAADSTATAAVNKSTTLGSFYHLPPYLKLYDALRATQANYKVSLRNISSFYFWVTYLPCL